MRALARFAVVPTDRPVVDKPIGDAGAVYEQVKREYGEQFGVVVSQPLGFENTFAILIRADDAQRLNLKTISSAIGQAKTWRAGFGQDFMSRDDGYPGFSKSYGLQFAEVREMDLSLNYIALAEKQVDLIAGNLGLNCRLTASGEQPVRMYYYDFDGNGRPLGASSDVGADEVGATAALEGSSWGRVKSRFRG
jgi:hypothetical protein